MTKIVDFTEAWNQKEDQKKTEEMLHEDSDLFTAYQFSFDAILDIVIALHEMDYNIGSDPKCITEIMLIEESLRSLVMRAAGKEYPFQPFCENLFADEDGEKLNHEELMRTFIKDLKDLT